MEGRMVPGKSIFLVHFPDKRCLTGALWARNLLHKQTKDVLLAVVRIL